MANVYLRAIGIGVIAGMRSMSAPAFVSVNLARKQSPLITQSRLRLFASPHTASVLKLFAAGEIIADKTTLIPNRISPVPLVARGLSGAICGAPLCASEEKRADLGSFAGGLAAIVSAFGFYHLRRRLTEKTGLPDVLFALLEDALVVGGSLIVLKNENPK